MCSQSLLKLLLRHELFRGSAEGIKPILVSLTATAVVEPYVHLVRTSPPVAKAKRRAFPLPRGYRRRRSDRSGPPHSHRLVMDVDPAFEQQALHLPQAQQKANARHDHEADHLGGRVEVAERATRLRSIRGSSAPASIAVCIRPHGPDKARWEDGDEPLLASWIFVKSASRIIGERPARI